MNTGVLLGLRRRLAGWLALRVGLGLAGVLGGAALAAVVLDAVLDLPETARVATPWVLGGCGAAVLGLGIWQWRRLGEPRVARLFERADPALGNRLINAVQLSAQVGESEVEEYLRREALELGRRAAAGVAVWPAVGAGVELAVAGAGAVLAAWVALTFLAGGVLPAVLPRFLDPHGDHPPFSYLRLEVSPRQAEVLYGGQVEVRATAAGRPVEKLWLVTRTEARVTRAIMFLAPDKTFFQTLANLREPAEYYVTDGRARSRRFPLRIRYTPQITLVETTMTFPAYTGKAARTAKLADEPQALPEDTEVSFRVASNRPLKGGRLLLTPVLGGQPREVSLVPMAGQGSAVTGGFTFTQAVVFSLSVRDVAGLESADPRQGRFDLLPDQRPRIFVLEPGRDAVATPSIRVPVRVQAEDDYGVTRVTWLRGLNRSMERPFSMKLVPKGGPQSVEAVGEFDCGKLGLRAGDVIQYYFEAADNYPKGPNLALSRLYRLQIISQEQFEAVLRQAAARKALFEPYFQLDSWLRRLAERARKAQQQAENGTAAEKAAAEQAAAALAEELSQYETELSKVLATAALFDVEQSFRETLAAQQAAVEQARKALAAGSGEHDPKKLAEAARGLSDLARKADEDIDQPAHQIAAVARLLAQADSFVRLARQQAALADLLHRFADKHEGLSRLEEMEMQDLAGLQRQVQEGLRSLLAALPESATALPDEPQYAPLREDVKAFLDAVAEAKIEDALAAAGVAIGVPDGPNGYSLAQVAAEKMDRLIAKCQGISPQQGGQCLRFQPKMSQGLGNTLEQILAAMNANTGNGQGGRDGYALFNDDLALYGPNVQLAGEPAGGRPESGSVAGRPGKPVPGENPESSLKRPEVQGRVRLQPNARFPLRYRDLVGEYFRVIGESELEGGQTK